MSNPPGDCVPFRLEQADKVFKEFPVPKYMAAFARCFRYSVCELDFVLVGLLPGIRYLLVGSLPYVVGEVPLDQFVDQVRPGPGEGTGLGTDSG